MAEVKIGNNSANVNSDEAVLEFQKAEHNQQRIKWCIIFVIVFLIVLCAINAHDMQKYIADGVVGVVSGKLGFGVYSKVVGKMKK
jgi:hypothetical protein